MEDPNFAKLSSMHFYGWKKGLKTGMYYLRSRAAVNAIQFTVKNTTKSANIPIEGPQDMACSVDSPEECVSCGS